MTNGGADHPALTSFNSDYPTGMLNVVDVVLLADDENQRCKLFVETLGCVKAKPIPDQVSKHLNL